MSLVFHIFNEQNEIFQRRAIDGKSDLHTTVNVKLKKTEKIVGIKPITGKSPWL